MDHQNRGNRDPLSVFPWWSAKTMRGSLFPLFPLTVNMRGSLFPLFPLFWWPMSIHPVKTWTTKIGEIGTVSVFSLGEVPKAWEGPYFPYFSLGWSAKTMRGSLFPLFPLFSGPILSSCQDMDHQNRGNRASHGFGTSPFGEIGEIGTLSVFSLDEVPKPWEGPCFPYFGGQCPFILSRHGPPK